MREISSYTLNLPTYHKIKIHLKFKLITFCFPKNLHVYFPLNCCFRCQRFLIRKTIKSTSFWGLDCFVISSCLEIESWHGNYTEFLFMRWWRNKVLWVVWENIFHSDFSIPQGNNSVSTIFNFQFDFVIQYCMEKLFFRIIDKNCNSIPALNLSFWNWFFSLSE